MQNAIDKDYLANRNIDNLARLEEGGVDALIGLVAVADRINKNKAFSNGYNSNATEQSLREVYHEPSAYEAWLGLRLPTWMIHPDVLILLAEGIQTSPITTHSNKHSFMCPISCERVVLGDVIDQYREIIQAMLEDAYRCFKVADRKPYKVPSYAKAYLAVWAVSFTNAVDMLDLANRLNYEPCLFDDTMSIDIAYVTARLLSFDDLLDAYKSKAIDEELFKDMICTERSGRRATAQPSWALKLALHGWPLRLNLPSDAAAEIPRPMDTIHKGVHRFLTSLFGRLYCADHRDAMLVALESILYSYGDALWDQLRHGETVRMLRNNLGYLSPQPSEHVEALSQRALADTFCNEAAVRRLSKVPMTLERNNDFYIKTTIYQEVVRRVLANDTEI